MFERLDEKLKAALAAVQKPGRYTGGEPGCVYKEKEKLDLRFAFCFPDTYEVGMSFLGMKILYEILNKRDNIWCERVFMPWVDMKEQMQQRDIPLYALESKDPLGMFDVVGFTLQYELSYTNILAMLDLAHIPFYAKDRGEDAPFIVAGGPCVCNAEPLADFFDLMMLGEGEVQLPDVCDTIIQGRRGAHQTGDIKAPVPYRRRLRARVLRCVLSARRPRGSHHGERRRAGRGAQGHHSGYEQPASAGEFCGADDRCGARPRADRSAARLRAGLPFLSGGLHLSSHA